MFCSLLPPQSRSPGRSLRVRHAVPVADYGSSHLLRRLKLSFALESQCFRKHCCGGQVHGLTSESIGSGLIFIHPISTNRFDSEKNTGKATSAYRLDSLEQLILGSECKLGKQRPGSQMLQMRKCIALSLLNEPPVFNSSSLHLG